MVPFDPPGNRIKKAISPEGIPQYLVFHPFSDGFHDEVRGFKIGIGNPDRDQIARTKKLFQGIVFYAVGAFTHHNFIKIIRFHMHQCFYQS